MSKIILEGNTFEFHMQAWGSCIIIEKISNEAHLFEISRRDMYEIASWKSNTLDSFVRLNHIAIDYSQRNEKPQIDPAVCHEIVSQIMMNENNCRAQINTKLQDIEKKFEDLEAHCLLKTVDLKMPRDFFILMAKTHAIILHFVLHTIESCSFCSPQLTCGRTVEQMIQVHLNHWKNRMLYYEDTFRVWYEQTEAKNEINETTYNMCQQHFIDLVEWQEFSLLHNVQSAYLEVEKTLREERWGDNAKRFKTFMKTFKEKTFCLNFSPALMKKFVAALEAGKYEHSAASEAEQQAICNEAAKHLVGI